MTRGHYPANRSATGHHSNSGTPPRYGPFVPAFATPEQRALERELLDAGYTLGRADMGEDVGIGWAIAKVSPHTVCVESLRFDDVLAWWRERIEPNEVTW